MRNNFHEQPILNEAVGSSKEAKEKEENGADKKAEIKFKPELLPHLKEAKDFLNLASGVFNTISGDPKPPLEFFWTNSRFYFDHRNNRVAVSLEHYTEMREQGRSREMIEWAMAHEIKHYSDMAEDPEGYLGNFYNNKEKGRKNAGKALDVIRQNNKDVPDYVSEKWAARFLEKQLHDLYNALDDIYVNRSVANHLNRFSKEGILGGEVRDFYAQDLFPGQEVGDKEKIVDYSKIPRSKQLGYYFLRKFMVPDEEIIISEEVRDKIYGYADRIAEKYGSRLIDEVYSITRPTGKYEKKQHTPSVRHDWIEKNIEPVFWQFLYEDLKSMPIPPKKEGQSQGEGEEGGDAEEAEGDEEENNKDDKNKEGKGKKKNSQNGDDGEEQGQDKEGGEKGKGKEEKDPWGSKIDSGPISEEEVKDFIKSQKEKEKERKKEEHEKKRWDRLSPEEKTAEFKKKADYDMAKKEGLSNEEVAVYHRLQKSVEKYKIELSEVFERVMKNIQDKLSFEWEKYNRRGKFNVNDFVGKYGADIASGQLEKVPFGRLDVFEQKDFIKKLHLLPNKIRVRLILDGSGSMSGEKINIVRRLSVLIMEALKEFEVRMNLKFRMDKKFAVDSQIMMFGSEGSSRIVKHFEADEPGQNAKAARMRAIANINSDYGSTNNSEAWEKVDGSIDYEKDIKEGKLREFCFEITDGGSDSPQESRNALERLEKKKIVTRGIQVGEVSEDEKQVFQKIWGKDGERVEDSGDLIKVMAKMLENEVLENQVNVVFDSDEEE